MPDYVTWYLASLLIAGGGVVPATILFHRLPTAGVLLARPIGFAFVALAMWMMSAFTPMPYGVAAAAASIAALYAWSAWIVARNHEMARRIRDSWRLLLTGELLFITIFAAVALLRAQVPAAIAIEKPMELMLLTVIHNARDMPPPDAWLAGRDVSYYHLGYVMIDALQQIASVPPSRGLNLGFATTVAMAAVAGTGLVRDMLDDTAARSRLVLVIVIVFGLLNLWLIAPPTAIWFEATREPPDLWWAGRFAESGAPYSAGVADWWWLNVESSLPSAITQFPSFLLVLGDMRPHLLNLPLFIAALTVAVAALRAGATVTWRRWWREPHALIACAIIFAGLATTNTWDAATCGATWAVFAMLGRLATNPDNLKRAVMTSAAYIIWPAIVALAIAAPILATFEGPLPTLSPNTDGTSSPFQVLGFWGTLAVPICVAAVLTRARMNRVAFRRTSAVVALPVVALAVMAVTGSSALTADASGIATICLIGLAAAVTGACAAAAATRKDTTTAAWLAMAAIGTIIILLFEMYAVTGGPGLTRWNTVLKFGFGTWTLLAVAGTAGIAAAINQRQEILMRVLDRTPFSISLVVTCLAGGAIWIASLAYVPAAVATRLDENSLTTLNSLAYLDTWDPGSSEAIRWASDHLDARGHVLLEAVSPAHMYGNTISAASGIPTVIGWPGHQRHWRVDPEIEQRTAAVEAIYRLGGDADAVEIARGYGVTHVYIGERERKQFPIGAVSGFNDWPVVFEHGDTRILAIPDLPQ